jgi:hypothetical protein
MEIEMSGGGPVGEGGGFVEEQDQTGALPEVRRGGASAAEAAGLGEEFLGEGRAMQGRGSGHGVTPSGIGQMVLSGDTPSIRAASGGREPYRYL